ncbi:MAG: ferredoxin [Candidatus Kryptoniota bacterium]
MIWYAVITIWLINFGLIIIEKVKTPKGCQDKEGFYKIKPGVGDRWEDKPSCELLSISENSCGSNKAASRQFFVTKNCNGCGLCKTIAPDFFDYVENVRSYFVIRQPETKHEHEFLRDASSVCIRDAIHETSIPNLASIMRGERNN